MLTPAQQALWTNQIMHDCLQEAGDDVETGLQAAEYILSTQPFPDDLNAALAVRHAPAGYTRERPLVIGGKQFVGGEFIPDEAWAKATPEEKAQVEGIAKPKAVIKLTQREIITLGYDSLDDSDPELDAIRIKAKRGQPLTREELQEVYEDVMNTVTYGADPEHTASARGLQRKAAKWKAFIEGGELPRRRTRATSKSPAPALPKPTSPTVLEAIMVVSAESAKGLNPSLLNDLNHYIDKRNKSAGADRERYDKYVRSRADKYGITLVVIPTQSLSIDAFFAHDIANRHAQGILNRAIKASKELSANAKSDLATALKRGKRDSGEAILAFIEKYRLQLAKLLSATQLASLLEGAREIAANIPTLAVFPSAIAPPPSLEPKEVVTLIKRLEKLEGEKRAEVIYDLPADQQTYVQQALAAKEASPPIIPPTFTPPSPPPGAPEGIHFPVIEEAIKQLAEKNVMTRDRFDALDAASRAKAFTVAGVDAQETLTKIRDALAENIREGADYEAFRQKVMEDVEPGTFLSEGHMETVFRTVVQTQFSDGQETVLSHPLIRSGFPYRAYDAIHDERVRDNHLALEKLGIGGTNVYRADDPVFQLFRPPWDYNDRCGSVPMTVRQAAEAGINEAIQWLETGVEPSPPAHIPMPSFAPPPGFQRAIAAAPLSIQLSMRSIDNFYSPNQANPEPLNPNAPTFPSDPDEYPRDTSNRFLDKYTIAEAARDPATAIAMRELLPEDQRCKLDRAIDHLTSGGAIHHPKEPSGLSINIGGMVVDPIWAAYSAAARCYEAWVERQACRNECRKAADKVVSTVRSDKKELDEIDTNLKDAGATDAEMRAISRARYAVNIGGRSPESLRELYEDVAEAIHRRIDMGYETDPELNKPEEPGNENTSVAFGLGPDGVWSGPNPPAKTGWVQIDPGPRGGKRWAKVGNTVEQPSVEAPQTPAPSDNPTHQLRAIGATLPDAITGEALDPAAGSWQSHKVLISDLYDALQQQGLADNITLDTFKSQLLDAHRRGVLELHRQDIPHAVRGQRGPERVAKSEVQHPAGATFHTVDIASIRTG